VPKVGQYPPLVAAENTQDETAIRFLRVGSALYAYDGTNLLRMRGTTTGLLRIAANGANSALADAISNTIVAEQSDGAASLSSRTMPHLFNGTTWDRWRAGGSASPLLGSALVTPQSDPQLQVDEAANDSDKIITVPSSTQWGIYWIHVEFVSTATVGNRQIELRLNDDSTDTIYLMSAGAVQTASLTRTYLFTPGVARETTFIDGQVAVPIPPGLWLPPSFTVRVRDSAAIDAAADDMQIQMLVDVRSV